MGLVYFLGSNADRFKFFDSLYGVSLHNERDFIEWLDGRTPGIHLAVGHAAVASDELDSLCGEKHKARPYVTTRPKDLVIFTSPAVKRTLKRNGIELIDFSRLLKLRAAE